MTLSTLVPYLFIAVPVGVFLVVNMLLWRIRKARWRDAAMLMNAEYSAKGFHRCGTIRGERNGRAFKAETRRISGGRSGKYTVTRITAPLANRGVTLQLPPAFFDRGCDPAAAFKKVAFTEDVRVFVTSMQVDRVKNVALTSKEQAQLAAALKGWNPTGKESVTVQSEEVVFSKMKVISDVRLIEELVDLVTGLGNRIEENPVGE